MNDTLKAIEFLLNLLNASTRALEQAMKVSRVIAAAQAEGRELTAEEWDQIIADDKAARDRLSDLAGDD